jgi:soluble lytic murein transglycosylase-like protein
MSGVPYAAPPARWNRRSAALALAAGLALCPGPSHAYPDDSLAALAATRKVDARGPSGLPRVLGVADAVRYRHAFSLMRRGEFGEADQVMAMIANDVVLGHVMAERLLHRRHRSSFRELASWLDRHADHPQAKPIHALALKRRTGKAVLRAPESPVVEGMFDQIEPAFGQEPSEVRSAADEPRRPRDRLSSARLRVRHLLKQDHFDAADRARIAAEAKGLSAAERLLIRADLVQYAFLTGRDGRAVDLVPVWAEGPATAHWFAGLAAWRSKDFDRARRHFETVARATDVSGWLASAGAFWAARSWRALANAEAVQAALKVAAEHPTTMYGQLARRQLGDLVTLADGLERSEADIEVLAAIPALRRAMALIEINEKALAVDELVAVAKAAPTAVADSIVAFARLAGLRDFVPRITAAIREAEGALFDDAMYPIPRWAPEGGFTVDRALIFAIIKQESNFRAHLVSPRGAQGPMQIMPRTAEFIGTKATRGRDLHDPTVNLTVGQRYLQHLLDQEPIRNNLVATLAAYNGGIGRVSKWLTDVQHESDPLLFMEAMPSAETRNFVERVIASMWIYQARLGQPAHSLNAVAAGQWPVYDSTDDPERGAVANAQNR